jgi:nickel-dependent lactate racemase
MIRDLKIKDLVALEKCAQFPLENLRNKMKILEKAVEDEKGLLGSVIVNHTAEISIILADRSTRDRVKALKEIEKLVYTELIRQGYRDLHTFILDPRYAEILVHHFGFEYVIGIPLVRRA